MTLFARAPVLLAVASGVACASYPAPHQHLADSVAAVRGAEEVGAASQPQAALNLKLAQDEVAQARALLANGDYERADYMTACAKADADLARQLAKQDRARLRAEDSEARARAVRSGVTVLPVAPPERVTP